MGTNEWFPPIAHEGVALESDGGLAMLQAYWYAPVTWKRFVQLSSPFVGAVAVSVRALRLKMLLAPVRSAGLMPATGTFAPHFAAFTVMKFGAELVLPSASVATTESW